MAVQAASFGGTLVLAHILTPKAYGVVGMARLATGFIDIFRDLGTAAAIIQREQLTEELLSTVFWANLLLGLASSAIVALIAPEIAYFFKEPTTKAITQVLALGFILSSFGSVHASLLARSMAFKTIAAAEGIAAVLGTAIAIPMALLGAGVWSLAIPPLVVTASSTIFFWLYKPWRPKLCFHWKELKSISSYSLNLSGFNTVNYFSRNADNAIVGRFLGAFELGFYQLAYNIMLYGVQNVTHVLGRVLFPAFAKLQNDNTRFRQAYTRAVPMIAVITFPAMAGLMAVAKPLVLALLGAKWLPVATLLTILAPVGLVQSVISTTGNIYYAKGRTDLLLRWGIFSTVVFVISFFSGLRWGINGVATGYLIASILLAYPVFSIPFRLIGLSMSDFLEPLWPIVGCSVTMAICVRLIGFALGQYNPRIQLLVLASSGAAFTCYFCFLHGRLQSPTYF